MFAAFLLVVTVLGNGSNRTAINAFATAAIGEKEAIGPVVGIWPGGRFNGYLGHYDPVRMALPLAVMSPSHSPKVPRPAAWAAWRSDQEEA